MRNISLHAVIGGGFVDVAGTFLSVLVVTIGAAIFTLGSSAPIESSGGLAAFGGPVVLAANLVLGSAWSIIGGYVAALIAKHDELLHGVLSSYFCVGLGIYGLFAGHGSIPLWMHVFGFTAAPALGAFGGSLRARQSNRAQLAPR